MSFKPPALVLLVALVAAGCARQTSFTTDVYPILEQNCLSCHSEGKQGHDASGFSVENYDTLMQGTSFGPVITPGSSASSTLLILVEGRAHKSITMPRGKAPLSAAQIGLIKKWIDEGAKHN